MISTDKINLIRDTANDNIVEVIGDFVELKKRGVQWVGLSPFNNERTPSFTIHPAKGIFKDFSSGNGGDVIKFLMLLHSWNFLDALKYLAMKFKVDIEDGDFVYTPIPKAKPKEIQPSFVQPWDLLQTLNNFENNALYKFICSKVKPTKVSEAFERYYIGTYNDWVIFWQVDKDNYCRSGKYIKYQANGHRDKSQNTTWHHKGKGYTNEFNLVQCFFGEHLILDDVRKPIAIVESEKTAVIASLFMPKYIWLAACSKYGLNERKCEVLRNRSVTLFPDLGCYAEWGEVARKYGFNISDHIEKIATDEQREKGLDLADFLI
jgi:hypothetical protein